MNSWLFLNCEIENAGVAGYTIAGGEGHPRAVPWLPFWKGEAGFFRNPDVHTLSVTPGNRR